MKNIVRRLSRAGREGQMPMPATPAGDGAGRRAARGLGAGLATGLGLPGGPAPRGAAGARCGCAPSGRAGGAAKRVLS